MINNLNYLCSKYNKFNIYIHVNFFNIYFLMYNFTSIYRSILRADMRHVWTKLYYTLPDYIHIKIYSSINACIYTYISIHVMYMMILMCLKIPDCFSNSPFAFLNVLTAASCPVAWRTIFYYILYIHFFCTYIHMHYVIYFQLNL